MKKLLFILLLAVATGCHKSDDGASAPQGGEVTVDFTLAGVRAVVRPAAAPAVRADEGAATPTTGTPVALAEGATVRILAFARAAANADIANDTFIAEATYVADASGELTPCVVDANGAVTAGTAKAMRVPPAEYKYDFYAITPAVAVPDHRVVSVAHGVDYACSLTSEEITPRVSGAQTVALNTLVRHCTQLAVQLKPSSTAKFQSMVFSEDFSLKYISKTPYAAAICSQWNPDDEVAWPLLALTDAEDAAYNYSIAKSKFVANPESPLVHNATDVVLPKRKSAFRVQTAISFDGMKATPLTAPVNSMAFAADRRYNFVVTLDGAKLTLILQVGPWVDGYGGDVDLDLGEWPHASITVGSWNLEIVNTELGGSFIPTVVAGNWVPNEAWDAEISGFPTLAAPHYPVDWNTGNVVDDNLGDSFQGDQTVPGWQQPSEGVDTDFGPAPEA